MHTTAAISKPSNVLRPASLPTTLGCIGAFAAFSAGCLLLQPGFVASAALAVMLSLSIAALSVTGLHDVEALATRRAAARWLSAGLMAALLWIAIMTGNFGAGAFSAVAASLLAFVVFGVLVIGEAMFAVAASSVIASATGADPALGVAVQVADKYAGLAGDVE